MRLRKRALVLGKFRFITPGDGEELETTSDFISTVDKHRKSRITYASKPIGFRTVPRTNTVTRYAILRADFPGISERFHVAWSTPFGDVKVDGMVKLYDLQSIQMHYIDCDDHGPKSNWFGLVDHRITYDGRVHFDANMFWTVGLLYKHYGTCGVEDWDMELAEMASTHNWAESTSKLTAKPDENANAVDRRPLAVTASRPQPLMSVSTNSVEHQTRYAGCVTEWRGSYGFVSCYHLPSKVFLHSSDIRGWKSGQDLPVGSSVNFKVHNDVSKGFRAINATLYT